VEQTIIDLYNEYAHTALPRRVFLERLARLAGGTAAAAALLPLLEACSTAAPQVAPTDPRLATERVVYPGATGPIAAYLAKPTHAGGRLPAVIVIHENRGLSPYIEDVARRLALAGYLALAPDSLSPLGGTPPDSDRARDLMRRLDAAQAVQNYVAAIPWLQARPDATGRVGCVGFCWGGGMANQLAVYAPHLTAAAVFYGPAPAAADVPRIRARLLLNIAGHDDWVNPTLPAYEAALRQAGVRYTRYDYPGTSHAFHNDTASARYNQAAAQLAWSRTLAFLAEALKP